MTLCRSITNHSSICNTHPSSVFSHSATFRFLTRASVILGALDRLEYLDLYGDNIRGPGLGCIGRLKNLHDVFLNSNPLGDEGMAAICESDSIMNLEIPDTEVTREGCFPTSENEGIEGSVSSRIAFRDGQYRFLQEAIPRCPYLLTRCSPHGQPRQPLRAIFGAAMSEGTQVVDGDALDDSAEESSSS